MIKRTVNLTAITKRVYKRKKKKHITAENEPGHSSETMSSVLDIYDAEVKSGKMKCIVADINVT